MRFAEAKIHMFLKSSISSRFKTWVLEGGGNGCKIDCRAGNFQFQGIFSRLNFNLSSLLFCFLIRLIAEFYGKVEGKYPQLELSIRQSK